MWYAYALELALGLVFAADMALVVNIGFRIKNQNLRALWVLTIFAHLFALVWASMKIADKFGITDHDTRSKILLFIVIPGGISEIWSMVSYWRRRKRQDPSYNIWTGRSEKKE